MNKQIYEKIFTYLQIHPCYLINWITQPTVNRQAKDVIYILKSVFGTKEMENNPRIIHILMMIARKLFQYELKNYDIKEIFQRGSDSSFQQIFLMIFEAQDENMLFVNDIIKKIVWELYKYSRNLVWERSKKVGEDAADELKREISQQFDYESVIVLATFITCFRLMRQSLLKELKC